jgi:hypothetical protein
VRKAVVILDAGFEAILATVLVLGVVYAAIDEHDFPAPATDVVIGLFALALYALAIGLATLVKNDAVTDRALSLLAAGNAAFALLIAAWVVLANGFSGAGKAVIATTVAGLLALAVSQAVALSRR